MRGTSELLPVVFNGPSFCWIDVVLGFVDAAPTLPFKIDWLCTLYPAGPAAHDVSPSSSTPLQMLFEYVP